MCMSTGRVGTSWPNDSYQILICDSRYIGTDTHSYHDKNLRS